MPAASGPDACSGSLQSGPMAIKLLHDVTECYTISIGSSKREPPKAAIVSRHVF